MENETTGVKVKMCGMMRPEDIAAANECKPDYVGFIFAANRKRTVTKEQVMILRADLSKEIMAVGVFLNQETDRIIENAKDCRLNMIQLHGNEEPSCIKVIKEQTGLPVIKAFIVKNAEDVKRANDSPADYILLDSGAGSGETFSWEILREVKRPFFLAGGLNPGNVKDAMERLHPYALDVSSGIETNGRKDLEKMIEFMRLVRQQAIG